jgi:hypothetical protein
MLSGMGRNRVMGAPYEQALATADLTTQPHIDRYLVVTTPSGPSITITLDPNAVDGDQVVIQDASGQAAAFPIQIVAGTGVIDGASVIDTPLGSFELTYTSANGGTWTVRAATAGIEGELPSTQTPGGVASVTLSPDSTQLTGTITITIGGAVLPPDSLLAQVSFADDVPPGRTLRVFLMPTDIDAVQAAVWVLVTSGNTFRIACSNNVPADGVLTFFYETTGYQ